MGRRARAGLVPLRLALVRARARPSRWLGAAGGVAVAVALLGGTAGLAVLVAHRTPARELAPVPPPGRTLALAWAGGVSPAVDRRAREALAAMTGVRAPQVQTRTVLLQPARLGRATLRLAGIAPLRRWVRLEAGRLPRGCAAARCEVLQL